MTDFKALLRTLADAGVEFILVGGVAGTVHGATRLTLDVDAVYRRSPANIERLVLALTPHHAYLRGAPPGLPFRWDAATIQRGLNFTLTTDIGDLDLLGEIAGGGTYEDLLPHCVPIQVFGVGRSAPPPGRAGSHTGNAGLRLRRGWDEVGSLWADD